MKSFAQIKLLRAFETRPFALLWCGQMLSRIGDFVYEVALARRDVETLGSEALIIPTDVANSEQIEAVASLIEERFGPIDIWINNAMVSVFSPVKEMKPDECLTGKITYGNRCPWILVLTVILTGRRNR